MPRNDPYSFQRSDRAFLEAEVTPSAQPGFQKRYYDTTKKRVMLGRPAAYQAQPNKRAAECRIYFNSHVVAQFAAAFGFNVTTKYPYRNAYRFRISSNELWWELVDQYGFRLGAN